MCTTVSHKILQSSLPLPPYTCTIDWSGLPQQLVVTFRWFIDFKHISTKQLHNLRKMLLFGAKNPQNSHLINLSVLMQTSLCSCVTGDNHRRIWHWNKKYQVVQSLFHIVFEGPPFWCQTICCCIWASTKLDITLYYLKMQMLCWKDKESDLI